MNAAGDSQDLGLSASCPPVADYRPTNIKEVILRG
jgi:hypothetical protein